MGLSLESALNLAPTPVPGFIAGRPLAEWNGAYLKVERYFNALRVGNKLLLGQLVTRVLDRAIQRASEEPGKSATVLAGEEIDRIVSEWYAAVLDEPAGAGNPKLGARGRLALLLADMPGKWQDQFLSPAPWPDDFIRAMRESYLRAGPDFQFSQITPRPIDLGAISTLTNLSNLPYFRMVLAWLAFAALLTVVFEATH
jgi:hypothetical protein